MSNRGRHKSKTLFKHLIKQLNYPEIFKKCFNEQQMKKLIENQILYGNTPNFKVFEKDPTAYIGEGGFNWWGTKEGYQFWYNLMDAYKNCLEAYENRT